MSNFDLVNWTMREARQLSPEDHRHSDIEGSSSLNNILLGVLEGERGDTFTLPPNAARLKARQIPRRISGRWLHEDRRKVVPASRRPDRIHDAAVTDGGLGNAQRSPLNVACSEGPCTGDEAPSRGCQVQRNLRRFI